MPKRPSRVNHHVFYLSAWRTGEGGPLLTLALASLRGQWLYAEVVNLPKAEIERLSSRHLDKLQKVPGTRFISAADTADTVQAWLQEQVQAMGEAPLRESTLEVRSALPDAATLLQTLLTREGHLVCGALQVRRRVPGEDVLAAFYDACGAQRLVDPHALLEAISLAYCDERRDEAMVPFQVMPFELLMGTKNAAGFRRWSRREAAPRTDRMRADAAPGVTHPQPAGTLVGDARAPVI